MAGSAHHNHFNRKRGGGGGGKGKEQLLREVYTRPNGIHIANGAKLYLKKILTRAVLKAIAVLSEETDSRSNLNK